MIRSEAIETLARHELEKMSPEARAALLEDWWSIDAEDPDYDALPVLLKASIEGRNEPIDAEDSVCDPLLLIALKRSFAGVLNEYVSERLNELGYAARVTGEVEHMHACPCCGYRSLRERGTYEICRVCFWEDDGTVEPTKLSPVNRMTLGEARRSFCENGAVSEALRDRVLPDGTRRYARDP